MRPAKPSHPAFDALSSQYLSGEISHGEYRRAVQQQRQRMQQKLDNGPTCTLRGPAGEDLDKEWDEDRDR